MNYKDHVYLGTVLLEKNRWSSRESTLLVSDWGQRFAEAGFDGIELWQNHALKATEEECETLKASPCPVMIFNSYAGCDDEQSDQRAEAVRFTATFSAKGMKYNFGRDKARHAEYRKNVEAWRAALPDDFRFLCECHGGTSVEVPEVAAETLDALGNGRYEAIVHGMDRDEDKLKRWFDCLGGRITHVHVQLGGPPGGPRRFMRLSQDPDFVRTRVQRLGEWGFTGSFTIEFTDGVSGREDIGRLFENAAADMVFLRKCLARL